MSVSAKKYWKAIVNILVAIFILVAVVWGLPKVLVFFMPFVVGWLIAWIASPLVDFFDKKLKIKRKAAGAVVIVTIIALVVLGIYALGAKLIREIMNFIEDFPSMWLSFQETLSGLSSKFEGIYNRLPANLKDTINQIGESAGEWTGDLVGELSSPTLVAVGDFAKRLPTIIICVIICLLASYFFVSERNQIKDFLRTHCPKTLVERWKIIKSSLGKAVGGYLKAQLKIELWVYLILVTGFLILQVDYALVIALGIAVLDVLPFLGTGTAMVPWAVFKMLEEEYPMAIGLLIIWGVSQLFRQIIQPKIVGDSVGVPPIPTLFLLYIGYMWGGVIDMIIAVPLGLIVWTLYQEGLFDTTKNSIQILVNGLNRFRKLTPADLEEGKKEKNEEL